MPGTGSWGPGRDRSATQKLDVALETLADGVARLRSGDDWQRFLALQAALHAYSPNNVLLIGAQHTQAFADGSVSSPDPGYVAGFNTWRALGRSVERGQRGYMVLAPCRYDRRVAVAADGSARALDRADVPEDGETLERRRALSGFRVEHVFSVHQTSGAELAEMPRPQLLQGEAPAGLRDAVVGLVERHGFSVSTVPEAGPIEGANGLTRWDTRAVLVRSDMDDAAVVKTLVHEAAHVLLHASPPGHFLPRALKEVEAESVAYVVGAAHGMQTDGYSFPYVAAWAGDQGAKAVHAVQGRVASAAREIIEASPAARAQGGRPPGAAAVIAAQARRAESSVALEGANVPSAGAAGL